MVLQLLLNGPPGSGKTTLAKLLCQELNLELVATGDLLRENLKRQTAAGRKAQRFIAANKLIPDRVVLHMVEAKITSCLAQGRRGWILDSFPRTTDQATLLMAKPHLCPGMLLLLDLPQAECTARISGRRFDPATGDIYHSPSTMPRDPVVRARLTRRRDDSHERLVPRFEAYGAFGEATNKMLATCQSVVVHRVDAFQSSGAIVENILVLLHLLAQRSQQKLPVSSNDIKGDKSNNQTQSSEKVFVTTRGRFGPGTIPETLDENQGDDGRQTYHYEWKDGSSSMNVNQRESSIERLTPEKNGYHVALALDSNKLSSSFSAALPLPGRMSKSGGFQDDHPLPSPPVPTLRPLLSPKTKLKRLQSSSKALNPSVQSASEHEIDSARSTSSSSIQKSMSTTTLVSAAASVDLETFREVLRDGFEAVKHGRRGRPHPRLIFTDLSFKRVFWQQAMAPSDRIGKGKHARLEQSIVLSDVIQIARGMKTAVLKRSGNAARYECYVSLVTPRRTLDLELPNSQLADFLQRGFNQLLLNE